MTTKQATKAQTTALATMPAVQLHRVLSDAAVFASTDETIPPICAVHIEFGNKLMLAVATDRFRLGVSKVDLDGKPGSLTEFGADTVFNLSLHDVTTVIRLAKTARRDEGTRFVWISQSNDGAVRDDGTRVGTVTFKFSDGATLDVKPQDAHFTKWRQLFPDSGSQVPRAASGFTAKYLADFGRVNGGDSSRIVMCSHDKDGLGPSTFTIGENFVGLLMPAKADRDHGYGQAEWVKPHWMG